MKNFIHVHRWSNSIQDYQYVGHLLYENELTGGAVSFFYDRDYINAGGPSLEPRNLATNKNHGKHVVTAGNGVLPLYFQQFLPGAYGQVMLKNEFAHFERLNQFPDNHTEGATDAKRAFFMGNALVVGVVEKLGKVLANEIAFRDK